MPIHFPSQGVLNAAFSPLTPYGQFRDQRPQTPRSRLQARDHLYTTWSVADDAKAKANQLSDAAVKEFEKASGKTQQATGKIQMFSAEYYAACTFGGLLACVRIRKRSMAPP
jgi:solute carrier family 25 (mitochondrial phosphate transporter), member 3